jgi:hypothetical protein
MKVGDRRFISLGWDGVEYEVPNRGPYTLEVYVVAVGEDWVEEECTVKRRPPRRMGWGLFDNSSEKKSVWRRRRKLSE